MKSIKQKEHFFNHIFLHINKMDSHQLILMLLIGCTILQQTTTQNTNNFTCSIEDGQNENQGSAQCKCSQDNSDKSCELINDYRICIPVRDNFKCSCSTAFKEEVCETIFKCTEEMPEAGKTGTAFDCICTYDSERKFCDKVDWCHSSPFSASTAWSNDTQEFVELEDLFPELDYNPIIPYVVITLLLLYLVLLLLLGFRDRLNHCVRPKFIVMTDIRKIREDAFYLISVETGNNILSGTTSNVCCQLYGTQGRSKEYVLKDRNMDTLRQNGTDSYLVSSTKYLGQLEKIRVWHDNSGPTPSWYCRKIIVRDIKTDEFWIFFIHRWLTVSGHQESIICRQLVGTKEEFEHYLENRFSLSRYFQHIREQHLYLSPATCPPRSPFLRVERLSCAFCVLFFYMFVLILLYGLPDSVSTASMAEFDVYEWKLGLLWRGIEASICGLFIGIIVVLLFRRIRKDRIPAMVCWERTKSEGKPAHKKHEHVYEIYRSETKWNDTDSEDGEKERWKNLDPDRVMVVGVPQDPVLKTNRLVNAPVTLGLSPTERFDSKSIMVVGNRQDPAIMRNQLVNAPAVTPELSPTESVDHVFQIPSTDMADTERWASEAINSKDPEETLVRTVNPPANKTPGWKRVMDYGLIAQMNQMRNQDPFSFFYKSSEPIENLIMESIRQGYVSESEEDVTDIPPNKSDRIIPIGHGDIHLPKTPSLRSKQRIPRLKSKQIPLGHVRHAKVQTDFKSSKSSLPLEKLFPGQGDTPEQEESEIELDERESSEHTIKPFVNPTGFSVELGELAYDFEHSGLIPRRYIFIPWTVCLVLIIIASAISIVYGARYGYVRSLNWCTSLGLAFLVSVLVFQPLKVLITFLVTTYRAEKHHWRSLEELRILNKLRFFWIIGVQKTIKLWPLNFKEYIPTSFQPPLSGVQIFMDKLKVRRKARVRKSLIDFVVCVVFLVLTVLAGDTSRDNSFYQNFETLEDILMLGNESHVLTNPNAFQNVRNDKLFHNYMQNVFIQAVQAEQDLEAIRTKNKEIVLLGVPRIRQLRVKPEAHDCIHHDIFRPHCTEEFQDTWFYSNKDTGDYSEGWEESGEDEERVLSGGNDFWRFRSAKETLSTYTYAELDGYDGSGYVADLGRIQDTSQAVLLEIERKKWIDSRTRVIFVEFSTYNPNINIHAVVILILEKSASLRYVPSSYALSWKVPIPEDPYANNVNLSNTSLIIIIVVFCSCLAYFFVDTVLSSFYSFRIVGFSAFRKFLLWLDSFIIGLGITVVCNHFLIKDLLDVKFTHLETNAHVSFQIEQDRQENQIILLTILTALVIVKVWYFLLISSRLFFIIGFTFSITGPYILGCVTIFFILLMGYCIGAYVSFGGHIYDYRFLENSILTQIYHAGLRNIMPYRTIVEMDPIFGRIFFFGFTVFVVLLFINVMASVITLGLLEAKETSLQRPFHFTFHHYIWLKLQVVLPHSVRDRFWSSGPRVLPPDVEAKLERVLIPILHFHLQSFPVKRMQTKKAIAEERVKATHLKLVSKKDKELAKKLKTLKIEEGRVNRMRELTIRHIRNRLRIDFVAEDLKQLDDFNFNVLQLKCRQLERKVNELGEAVMELGSRKINQRQFNLAKSRGMENNLRKSFDPWGESESETVLPLK